MGHIKDRYSTLKQIHRSDIQEEEEKEDRYDNIIYNFDECFFDQHIDHHQAQDNQTEKKIAYEIS